MRGRLNYLKIISFNDLELEFEFYCFKHKNLSLRRNAYNFVRSQTCIKSGRNPWIEAYEIAKTIDTSDMLDVVEGEPNI